MSYWEAASSVKGERDSIAVEDSQRKQESSALALEVMQYSRETVLITMRFLDEAYSRLTLQETDTGSLSTDGVSLFYNPLHILQQFSKERTMVARDLLHVIMHCLFRHPSLGRPVQALYWDLACDIAVEAQIEKLQLPAVQSSRSFWQKGLLQTLGEELGSLSVQRIYRHFLESTFTREELGEMRAVFLADDHHAWYPDAASFKPPKNPGGSVSDLGKGSGEPDEDDVPEDALDYDPVDSPDNTVQDPGEEDFGDNPQSTDAPAQLKEEEGADTKEVSSETGISYNASTESGEEAAYEDYELPSKQRQSKPGPDRSSSQHDTPDKDLRGAGMQSEDSLGISSDDFLPGDQLPSGETEELDDTSDPTKRDSTNPAQDNWDQLAARIEVDLESFSRGQGDSFSHIVRTLALRRERFDYGTFLRQFASLGEVMQLNDEEFDLVYYSYGLQLYDNMPLIEPLEYREAYRIREFAIAIDTSASTDGELVKSFITKTYNMLKQTESFFDKVNIHIIQCDCEIRDVSIITSSLEFSDYLGAIEVHGMGGTDFRPVFDYLDELIKHNEFEKLSGLIYFTDGLGTFPTKKPDYKTAFVFLEKEADEIEIPPWAIKVLLESENL